MSYFKIVDTSILNPLIEMYRNGYRKANNTSNGVSFQKEDKFAIGKEVERLYRDHMKYEESVGYVSIKTIAIGLAEALTSGEKMCTIHGRLNLWRGEYNKKVKIAANKEKAAAKEDQKVEEAVSMINKPAEISDILADPFKAHVEYELKSGKTLEEIVNRVFEINLQWKTKKISSAREEVEALLKSKGLTLEDLK